VFPGDTVKVLEDIRSISAPDDVIAYLPSSLIQEPVLGRATETTNFAITALTGLDGYTSSGGYSISFAVPGLHGRNEAEILGEARQIYEQRRNDLESFVRGDTGPARLLADHVRWIVISTQNLHPGASSPAPWRKTADVVVYKLCP
jgi:hypothetical protein